MRAPRCAGGPHAEGLGWRWSTAGALGLLASCAAPSSPYLGTWEDEDGRPAPTQVDTFPGEEHCDWESAVFLSVVWPAGGDRRQFVRDPEGVVDPAFRTALATDAALPDDATPTGLATTTGVSLWLPPGDANVAYLVEEDGTVERWPRVDPPTGCD